MNIARPSRVPAALAGALALAAGCLGAAPARAALITVTTTGTIDSGTDTSGVFGPAGASLAGRAYTLALSYDSLGSSTYGSASSATASGAITGAVGVTVGGQGYVSQFVDSYGALLLETPSSIYASNVGDDGNGEALSATNAFYAAGTVFPVDLGRSAIYAAGAADAGLDAGQVTFSADDTFGGTAAFAFTATPSSVSMAVPEPASLALLAGGIGLAGLIRRRRTP